MTKIFHSPHELLPKTWQPHYWLISSTQEQLENELRTCFRFHCPKASWSPPTSQHLFTPSYSFCPTSCSTLYTSPCSSFCSTSFSTEYTSSCSPRAQANHYSKSYKKRSILLTNRILNGKKFVKYWKRCKIIKVCIILQWFHCKRVEIFVILQRLQYPTSF